MRDYIGSGHIAAIMGLSPWSNPVKVWLELTDPNHENELNKKMKSGIYFEPGIAAWWADENQKNILKASFYRHKDKPYLGATPDFIILDENEKLDAILEVKNTHERNLKLWEDDAPDYYVIQLLWQMHITGIHKGVLCACIGGQQLKWIDVNYDAEVGQKLEDMATAFWLMHVEPKVCPPLESADNKTLAVMFKDITKGKEVIVPICAEDFERFETWKAAAKDLDERIENFKTRLKAELKDAECAISNDGKYKIKISQVNKKEFTVPASSHKRMTIKPLTEKEIKFLEGAK